MRVDISFKNMKSSDYLDNAISKDVDRIQRRTRIFKKDDAVHLSLHLEKNYHREQYFAWANLYMPRKVIRVQQQAPEASLAVNKVSHALIRQIDKYKVVVEKHLRRRQRILDKDE
ncbi:HPF/RaiA family ribosome-associated protein [Candidatus Omnitrophota bacterium]